MLNQILAKLVAKYPGLSKAFLGLVAAQLATKVTEEGGIDQAITDYDNAAPIQTLATEFQKEGDRRVNDAKKEWEKKNPPKPADPTEPPKPADPAKPTEEQPAWLKGLTSQLATLATQVATLSKEKQTSSMQSRLAEKLKDKVPAGYYKGRALPEKEEDFDAFVSEIETDWTAFKQEQVNLGLMNTSAPPAGGEQGGVKVDNADADIANWSKSSKQADTTIKK